MSLIVLDVRRNTFGLYFKQAPILAIGPRDEFGVGALFDDAATIEYQYAIEPLYGGQAMGDDEGGTSFREPVERVANQCFGHGIEARRGFV